MWKLMLNANSSDATSIDVKETRKVIRALVLMGSSNHVALEVNTGYTITLEKARELEKLQGSEHHDKCWKF
jgi:hypothetical protein